MKLNVTVKVEKVDFDPQDLSLRLKGKNVADNRFIKLGQYHTLELSLQRDVWISKDSWDSVYLDRIEQACDVRAAAEIAAVVMEQGVAHVCLITPFMTRLMAKVELSIPRKRPGNQDHRTKVGWFAGVSMCICRCWDDWSGDDLRSASNLFL